MPAGRIRKTDAEWRDELTREQYEVLRKKGTERAFSGKYVHEKAEGVYRCAGCGAPLFSSDKKYDSGSGWPSFTTPVDDAAVEAADDDSLEERRTEALCARCGGHLGHVFDDGPEPQGKRFCINSASLALDPAKSGSKEED